jgi:hypothetical protein
MATRQRKQPRKDPKGGLTSEGRKYFRRTEGAHLRPGVTGPADTPDKQRRKGSFLRRHYAHLRGPLTDEKASRRGSHWPQMRGASLCPRRKPLRPNWRKGNGVAGKISAQQAARIDEVVQVSCEQKGSRTTSAGREQEENRDEPLNSGRDGGLAKPTARELVHRRAASICIQSASAKGDRGPCIKNVSSTSLPAAAGQTSFQSAAPCHNACLPWPWRIE